MKAVEIRSLAAIAFEAKAEEAVAAVAVRRNARRARSLVDMEEMVPQTPQLHFARSAQMCIRIFIRVSTPAAPSIKAVKTRDRATPGQPEPSDAARYDTPNAA